MSLGFHIKVLRNRFIRLNSSIDLAIGEYDPEIVKLDKEAIKKDFNMINIQIERVKKRIDYIE